MKYAIDSDILIYYLKNHPKVVERFVETDLNALSTTIINLGVTHLNHNKLIYKEYFFTC